MLNYVCCLQPIFLMFKHWFCWKYQYHKYMFNFIDHLHCYFCEWLCRLGPSALLSPGAYYVVKTALISTKKYIAMARPCQKFPGINTISPNFMRSEISWRWNIMQKLLTVTIAMMLYIQLLYIHTEINYYHPSKDENN